MTRVDEINQELDQLREQRSTLAWNSVDYAIVQHRITTLLNERDRANAGWVNGLPERTHNLASRRRLGAAGRGVKDIHHHCREAEAG